MINEWFQQDGDTIVFAEWNKNRPRKENTLSSKDYDYIIVGAGTSGCCLANILSKRFRILLLEGGPDRENDSAIRDPKRAYENFNVSIPTYWNLPKSHEKMDYAAAKLAGGSSSVNGMQCVWGTRENWQEIYEMSGNDPDWSPESVFQTYRELETVYPSDAIPNRGSTGNLSIRVTSDHTTGVDKFLQAVQRITQTTRIPDYNNPDTPVGYFPGWQLTQTSDKKRCSSDFAFLTTQVRNKITIRFNATVNRLLWNSNRVDGVSYDLDGTRHDAFATKGVLLCCGIQSPLILMKNGVGPVNVLQKEKIRIKIPNEHVGRHLKVKSMTKVITPSRTTHCLL